VVTDPLVEEIPYQVSYDTAAIDEQHAYTVRVRVEDPAGTLLYVNDEAIPVITEGAPTEDVPIPVVAVSAEESADSYY
jgi:uncharacterized lipoprotein YbaY